MKIIGFFFQARASTQWMVHSDFGLTTIENQDTSYPNVLLTCINPLNSMLAEQFYPQPELLDHEISNYSWMLEVDPEDQLIFAPHAIDSPFQVRRAKLYP